MEMLQVGTVFFYFSVLGLVVLPSCSHCETVLVGGVSEWKDTTVKIGDSIIFRLKYHYTLYIFRTRSAFNLCNFNQAAPLTKPNTPSYTWRPTRLGNFYFSFYNGTNKPCQQGQKLAIKVIPISSATNTVLPPAPAPAPVVSIEPPESPPPAAVAVPPAAGGVVSSSPAFPWPFQPREGAPGPGSAPAPLATAPQAGGSVPFINSNPAVPLPTGEVDSATIHPLPTSAENHASREVMRVVGLLGVFIPQCTAVLLLML